MTTQPHSPLLHQLALPGGTVEYIDHGGPGEPVLLIHAGAFGAWFEPLATQPALNDFRAIRMLRAGYTDAPPPTAPLSIAAHAGHDAAVLEHLHAGPRTSSRTPPAASSRCSSPSTGPNWSAASC